MLPLFSSERCKLNCNSVKVGIPSGKTWKKHPENSDEKTVQTLEALTEGEKLLSTSAKHESNPRTRRRKNGTSNPRDEMAPQKIEDRLDGGRAKKTR